MSSHPYGLGRKPLPPDERDYRLENFLGLGRTASAADPVALIDLANAEFRLTTVKFSYWAAHHYADVTATHWWKAFDYLAQARAALSPTPPPPSGDVIWENAEPVLDQGNYGTCVGNAWAQWGNAVPIDDRYDETDARAIYYEATVIDGTPDDPDAPGGGQEGATTRAGVKAMQNRKRLSTYAFASSIETAYDWLKTKGPVVMGTVWTDGMFETDADGYLHYSTQDAIAGGHEWLVLGYLASENAVLCLNSWGANWGLGGYFKLSLDDLSGLFDADGEAVATLELPL